MDQKARGVLALLYPFDCLHMASYFITRQFITSFLMNSFLVRQPWRPLCLTICYAHVGFDPAGDLKKHFVSVAVVVDTGQSPCCVSVLSSPFPLLDRFKTPLGRIVASLWKLNDLKNEWQERSSCQMLIARQTQACPHKVGLVLCN